MSLQHFHLYVRFSHDASQVDARNVDGSTPLCEACSVGSLECVKLLLERGAKANPALTSRTASPLHEACMGGEGLGSRAPGLRETAFARGLMAAVDL